MKSFGKISQYFHSVPNSNFVGKSERNFGVDLARTIAITGVILVHTTGIGFGRWGVQLFFMVSGYLLANYREYESSTSFLIRRAARLFPLYLIFLFSYSQHFDFIKILLLGNLNWNTQQIPGAWSISSEWIYSLLLVSLLKKSRSILFVLLLISLSLQIALGFYVYELGGADNPANQENYQYLTWLNTTNPFINLSFFLLGIAIRWELIPIIRSRAIHIIIILVCIYADFAIGHLMPIWNTGIYSVFLLCLFSNLIRPLQIFVSYIGKRTYGMFFFHFVLLAPIGEFVSSRIQLNPKLNSLASFILVFSLASLFGSISWRLIELPFVRLSSEFSKKYLRHF
jgi:peptidoglycan/LPS O-acetylase OafA/YrhL